MDEITITMSRDEALHLMGDIMGDISQRCIFMTWYEEMEDEIPQVVAEIIRTGEEQPFETGWISLEKAKLLQSLADQLGHWVHLDDNLGHVPYTPKLDQ